MGAITDVVNFDTVVYSIDTTDPLLGGNTGALNKGIQNLANRTAYLYAALNNYATIQVFAVNHTLTAAEILSNLVLINADSATITITLPASAGLNPGSKAVISAIKVNKSQVKIASAGADKFVIGSDVGKSAIYLGDGDTVELILTALGWLMVPHKGNFDDIGGVIHRYKQLPNTLIAQGQLINRIDYPRIWEYAQTLGPSLVSDITWAGAGNHGFFSTGNGTTTFRLPDLRAMFIRGLDLGAGIDLGRASSNPGAYEADDFKSHDHGAPPIPFRSPDVDRGTMHSSFSIDDVDEDKRTGFTGGLETRPMNTGLLPLIKI